MSFDYKKRCFICDVCGKPLRRDDICVLIGSNKVRYTICELCWDSRKVEEDYKGKGWFAIPGKPGRCAGCNRRFQNGDSYLFFGESEFHPWDFVKKDKVGYDVDSIDHSFFCDFCQDEVIIDDAINIYRAVTAGSETEDNEEDEGNISDNELALLLIVRDRFEHENYAEAIHYCNKILENNIRSSEAWLQKGKALGILGKNKEALRCFDKCVEIEPEDEFHWYFKAFALRELGEFEEALFNLKNALKINPDFVDAWNIRADIWKELGNKEESLNSINRSLEIDSNDGRTWFLKGMIFYYFDEFDEALDCFNIALDINPNDEAAREMKENTMDQI